MTVKKAIEALLETYGSAMQRQRGAESTDFRGFLQPVSISAARSSASAKTQIRFVFFMVFYPQKSQKSVLLQGMIRV